MRLKRQVDTDSRRVESLDSMSIRRIPATVFAKKWKRVGCPINLLVAGNERETPRGKLVASESIAQVFFVAKIVKYHRTSLWHLSNFRAKLFSTEEAFLQLGE